MNRHLALLRVTGRTVENTLTLDTFSILAKILADDNEREISESSRHLTDGSAATHSTVRLEKG